MTTTTAGLALLAALGWAIADYLGARAGKKVSSLALTFYLQFFIGIFLLPPAIVIGGHISLRDCLIGLGAGVFNIIGYGLLVEGMRRHRIGVVVPSSSVTSTLVTVVAGIALGDSLSLIAVFGIIASIAGVTIASSQDSFNLDRGALTFGICSGLGFALMYVFLARTPTSAGIWPIIAMRFAGPCLYFYARLTAASLRLDRELLRQSVLISIVGLVALPAFTVAARSGSAFYRHCNRIGVAGFDCHNCASAGSRKSHKRAIRRRSACVRRHRNSRLCLMQLLMSHPLVNLVIDASPSSFHNSGKHHVFNRKPTHPQCHRHSGDRS